MLSMSGDIPIPTCEMQWWNLQGEKERAHLFLIDRSIIRNYYDHYDTDINLNFSSIILLEFLVL